VLALLSDIRFGISEYSDYESVGLDFDTLAEDENPFFETKEEYEERTR
jgi:hypothetical protein